MNIEGKTQAVRDWLETWPELEGRLKLNAAEMQAGELAMNPVYNDTAVKEYINGACDRAYTFSLVMVRDWSDGFDGMNADAMAFGERWLEWVSKQYDAGNVPDFGAATILSVEPLQNVPGLAEVSDSEQLARYLFQTRIVYREPKEV